MITKLFLLLSLFFTFVAADGIILCHQKTEQKRHDKETEASLENLKRSENFFKKLFPESNKRGESSFGGETFNERIMKGALALDDAQKMRSDKNNHEADEAVLRNLLAEDILKQDFLRRDKRKRSANSVDYYEIQGIDQPEQNLRLEGEDDSSDYGIY